MDFQFDTQFILRWLQIVMIDLMLAGDNALVIALAVRDLPPEKQFWGRVWGTFGAVALRLLFILAVTYVLKVPFLQAVGGALLLGIAVKLVRHQDTGGENVRSGASIFEAIWIIVVADIVMSLDNVIAIAGAAHGDFFLVAFGIALSLPLVVWGSGVLARLMNRFVWVVWVGGGVLGHVAGSMISHDPALRPYFGAVGPILDRILPWSLAVFLTILGWWLAKQRRTA